MLYRKIVACHIRGVHDCYILLIANILKQGAIAVKNFIEFFSQFNRQQYEILSKHTGPSCSKLTMSLVKDSLKFTSGDTQIY